MKQISSNLIHLDDLLSGLTKENLGNFKNLLIKGISLDSRQIGEGFLFCALTGEKANGNHFIEEAFKRLPDKIVVLGHLFRLVPHLLRRGGT